MKKSIITLTAITAGLFLFFNNVKAQKGFQIGLEGTPHMSWLINQDDFDSGNFDYLTGVKGSFGISSQLGITENVGVALNVLYSVQGQRYTWKNEEFNKKIEYVKIPLMLSTFAPMGENAMFIGKIGPQIGILSRSMLDDANGNEIISDHNAAYNNADFGGVLSLGFAFNLVDNLTLDASIRSDYGFTNAENEDYIPNIHNPSDVFTPSPRSSPRKMSSNLTTGITIGIRYLFPTM